jgi:hypothetical protein
VIGYDGGVKLAARIAVIVLLAACRSSGGGGSRSITVSVYAGDVPEPSARVIGHSPDGELIDQTAADAVGRAEVGVDDDSLLSVIFPGSISSSTSVLSIVTVPALGEELAIYGPPRSGAPPLTVGVLQIDGPALAGAGYFTIQIGCATARASSLPATIDVGACSMGSDSRLDVLVAGYHDLGGDPPAPQLDGYAAARVQMINSVATFVAPAWQTAGTSVPVLLDGVTPVVSVELFSDGLSYGSQPATDHATLWDGLVVDAARITASLPGTNAARVTTRDVPGSPASIALSADDFLPPVEVTTAVDGTTVTWEAANLGDAVNLHATWQLDHRVIWDVVLPPDATNATLPSLPSELGVAITPVNIAPTDIVLRYVDSDAHDSFAALLAGGVHAEDTLKPSTIAPRPTDGEIRVSHTIGLR